MTVNLRSRQPRDSGPLRGQELKAVAEGNGSIAIAIASDSIASADRQLNNREWKIAHRALAIVLAVTDATIMAMAAYVQWAQRDSNPRLLPCKGSTLAN